MTPTLHAMRAITGVYFQKMLALFGAIAGGILLLLYIITAILASQVSAWWWLLLIILFPLTIAGGMVTYILYTLSSRLMPRKLQPGERRELDAFSSKIFHTFETVRTPLPMIAVLIAKDVVRGKESQVIKETIDGSYGLKGDFERIRERYR